MKELWIWYFPAALCHLLIWVSSLGMDGALSLVAVALRGECKLAVGCHLVRLILQQARHVSVGDAVMVAAEADVVLFQFDGPEGGIELAVLVLPVGVNSTDEAQQQQHYQNDDGKDDDVELRPGDFRQGRRGVVSGAAQAGQQGLGGGCSAQHSAHVAAGRLGWAASCCRGSQRCAGGERGGGGCT